MDNAHDAEEVVQDAFFNAYQGLGQLEDAKRFKSWLAEITRNCARQWLRKQRDETVSLDEVNEQTLQTEDSPDEQLARLEQRELIRRTIETLPQKDRELVRAFYLEGASYDELTNAHGLSYKRSCVSVVACQTTTLQTVAIPSHWHLYFSHNDTKKRYTQEG